MPIRVTVWNEFRHERKNPAVAKIYPEGMHQAIGSHLRKAADLQVRTATLDEPEHGLTDDVLKNTDVLTWWAHLHHKEVADAVVERVCERVLAGMGLLVLHSGHFSKIFKRLMGTTCNLKWREHENEREILWVTRPGHPLVRGDVRRVLRHPRARANGHDQQFHGRRSVPQPVHVEPRGGPGGLLPAGA
jgi:trehalose utilization protein